MPHGNLMSSMTCLIGLPRCGSQYIASLFKTNSSYNIKNISEPFTPNHKSSLDIMDINIDEFNTYEEQVTVVIDRLKSISKHQSLILKLFLHSWIPITEHARIIQVLKELNFKFIIVKRKNITNQLLSLGIGLKLDKFSNFGDYDNSIVELDNDVLSSMKILQDDLLNFNDLLNNLELADSDVVHYETIQKDLSMLLGKSIKMISGYKKMSSIPSMNRISNIDEVLNFLNIK